MPYGYGLKLCAQGKSTCYPTSSGNLLPDCALTICSFRSRKPVADATVGNGTASAYAIWGAPHRLGGNCHRSSGAAHHHSCRDHLKPCRYQSDGKMRCVHDNVNLQMFSICCRPSQNACVDAHTQLTYAAATTCTSDLRIHSTAFA
jgi:hypothetical protein